MFQMTSPSNKPKQSSAVRDFPDRCGTQSIQNQTSENGGETRHESVGSEHGRVVVANRDYNHMPACFVDRLREVESIDVIMKRAGFNVPANADVGRRRMVSSFSKFRPSCGSKVKPLSSEEAISLVSSQSRRRQASYSSTSIQRNSPQRSNATALRASQNRDEGRSNQLGLIPVRRQNKITKVLSPREKVQKALRLFKLVFEQLDRDKAAETNKLHYITRTILRRDGMQVNGGKMIGPVPGIEVGDEFQYKSELSLVGLHFDIRGGIDYTNRGDMTLATSIISSEGTGYMDKFNSGTMIYCGQGGNLTSKDQSVMEDQKLVTGNLALVHSMWERTPVRVIIGKKGLNDRGKRYVYDGLYLVQYCWEDRGPGGKIMFKYKLSRVPGQPSTNLNH